MRRLFVLVAACLLGLGVLALSVLASAPAAPASPLCPPPPSPFAPPGATWSAFPGLWPAPDRTATAWPGLERGQALQSIAERLNRRFHCQFYYFVKAQGHEDAYLIYGNGGGRYEALVQLREYPGRWQWQKSFAVEGWVRPGSGLGGTPQRFFGWIASGFPPDVQLWLAEPYPAL